MPYLEYFLSLDQQLDVSGPQVTLDLFSSGPVRHVDFNEDLIHGLVPRAPWRLAGDDTAPLLEVYRHATAARRLTDRLTSADQLPA